MKKARDINHKGYAVCTKVAQQHFNLTVGFIGSLLYLMIPLHFSILILLHLFSWRKSLSIYFCSSLRIFLTGLSYFHNGNLAWLDIKFNNKNFFSLEFGFLKFSIYSTFGNIYAIQMITSLYILSPSLLHIILPLCGYILFFIQLMSYTWTFISNILNHK